MKFLWLWLLGVSIPFSIRTTLIADTIREVPNPFITVYLYGSDLLLMLLCLGFVYESFRKGYFLVPDWFLALIGTGIWSVLISDYPWMSFLIFLRILIFVWVCINGAFQNVARYIWGGFILGMILQVVIVMIQFITQASLAIPLIVQPVIDVSLGGVAKVELLGHTLIRAPGTFPHPNILAFALLLVLWRIALDVLPEKRQTVWKGVLFGGVLLVAQLDHYLLTSTQGLLLLGLSMLSFQRSRISFARLINHPLLILSVTIALFLTFSKTGLILAFVGWIFFLTLRRYPRMFHVEHFQQLSSQRITQVVLVVSILSFWSVLSLAFLPTAENRLFYMYQSWIQVVDSSGRGVGFGRFVANLPENLPFWRYQPVHSVPLLLIAEMGFGLVIGGGIWLIIRYIQQYESQSKLSNR